MLATDAAYRAVLATPGLGDADDQTIFAVARSAGAIVVTKANDGVQLLERLLELGQEIRNIYA